MNLDDEVMTFQTVDSVSPLIDNVKRLILQKMLVLNNPSFDHLGLFFLIGSAPIFSRIFLASKVMQVGGERF